MAEPLRDKVPQNALRRSANENSSNNIECAVCLQTCVHPAKLPCGHIFCYLCIKGIVNQGRRCAMCRQDIPVDYLDKPRLLKPLDAESTCQGFEDGHLWFYEGHNGWWQYDERTSLELESAYQKGERCCELLIAGYLYIADFDTMLQYRSNDPCRRRRIKRDLATITKKGVAGLKSTKDCSSTASSTPDVVSNILVPDLESLHISGQPTGDHGNENRVRRLSYPTQSISSHEQSEPAVNERTSRSNSLFSLPSRSSNVNTQNDLDSHTDSRNFVHTNNFELDNIIIDTLDWTIDQIESLNLELANDYENLLREVNNYGLHNNILDASRSVSSNNPLRQHSVPHSRPNRSLGSRSLSSNRTGIPELNHSEENRIGLETSQVSSCENNSSENERLPNSSLSLPSSTTSSQTPFETSVTSRRRPRRVSPSSSSSLRNHNVIIDSKK